MIMNDMDKNRAIDMRNRPAYSMGHRDGFIEGTNKYLSIIAELTALQSVRYVYCEHCAGEIVDLNKEIKDK